MAYAEVKWTYKSLASSFSGDPVPRIVMLVSYYRSFAHSCDLEEIELWISLVGDKGATIIACGLKLSTKVIRLDLCKQIPTRL